LEAEAQLAASKGDASASGIRSEVARASVDRRKPGAQKPKKPAAVRESQSSEEIPVHAPGTKRTPKKP
jgi:hypothetical protein